MAKEESETHSVHRALACLRLLRKELTLQKRDLEDGRYDLAVSRFKTIRPVMEGLMRKSLPQDRSGRIYRVMEECDALNDRVESLFTEEAHRTSRDLFEHQIEEQLFQLRRNSDAKS